MTKKREEVKKEDKWNVEALFATNQDWEKKYNEAKEAIKDITKFNAQYPKLSVKTTTDFHDRFLIINKTGVYHIGASIKDAGKKSFGITKIEDKDLIQSLINKVR